WFSGAGDDDVEDWLDSYFTAYIEEVLQLCRRSNPDMTEKQKVNHILK
ncbi:uncharacterized protein LOC120838548, partial [Ixodes scapularis]